MGKIIGIDLGTTNSVGAVMIGNESEVFINTDGDRLTPSIIGFAENGEILVGTQAKNQMITNPENTVRSIKRFMGRKYSEVGSELRTISFNVISGPNGDVRVRTRSGDFAPPQISAMVLKKIKEAAETFLGEPVTEAVITVPAYFNDAQRQATKDAGRIAGLDVKRILNEPTAAALAYGLDKKKQNLKVAVFDFGGGTFDISILELGEGVFEVKATNGDTHLGGDDLDQVIIDWMVQEFRKDTGIDLSIDKMALQRLKDASERAKKELSNLLSTEINLPFIASKENKPYHMNYTLSRAKFETLADSLFKRLYDPCLKAIKDSGFSVTEIDEVLLVGGATRSPKIQEIAREIFKKEPSKKVNPDEVVAAGAAIQAGVLSGEVKDILLLDVTPLSLGIETLGGVFTRIIERNTTIPAKKSQNFSTADDNQNAVSIRVFQGEREIAANNKMIGQFDLVGIPPAPRNIPQIEVTFDIDANGILHVSAKDMGTGKEQSIRIQASSGLNETEIQKMVKDGELHSADDRNRKDIIELKNRADNAVYQIEKLQQENSVDVPAELKAKVETAVVELKNAEKTEDKEKISDSLSRLAALSEELSKTIYQQKENKGGKEKDNSGQNNNGSTSAATEHGEKVVDADFEIINK